MSEKVSASRARHVGPGRRRFLKSALGALLALPAGAALAGTGAEAARARLPDAPAGPVARRIGDHFLVEGWVLTEADLRALGVAVPVAGIGRGAARFDAL